MKRRICLFLVLLTMGLGRIFGQVSISFNPDTVPAPFTGSITFTGVNTNFGVATQGMNMVLTNVNTQTQYTFGNAPFNNFWWQAPQQIPPIFSFSAPVTLPSNAPLGWYNAQFTGFGFFGQNYNFTQNNALFVGYNPVTFSGSFIHDRDSNCVQGGADQPFSNRVITVTPGPYFATTNGSGNFTISLPPGQYTFSAPNIPGATPLCPVSNSITVTNNIPGSTTANVNFFHKSNSTADLEVSIATGPHRPGFNNCWGTVSAHNYSSIPATNVLLKVVKPSNFTYVSASTLFPSSIVGDTLTWNVGTVQPYTSVSLTYFVLVPIGTPLNAVFNYNVLLQSSTQEANLSNNVDIEPVMIVGSYDPNDKQVWTANNSNADGFILPTDTLLRYLIRFQNTGTDTAFNIHILDTFDLDLDMSSMRIVGASHPYQLVMTDSSGRNLDFFFPNILLLDSFANEPLSHGFIEYTIKKKNGLANGTVISNTAAIYFDFNSPVITNTVNSKICPALPTTFTATPNGQSASFSAPTSGVTSWSWDFGDNTTGTGANVTHAYSAPGTYQVCLTMGNSCGRTLQVCQPVTVTCSPMNAAFTSANPSGLVGTFTNNSTGGGLSYLWSFGNGSTSTTANPLHVFSAPGTYQVCLITTNACAQQDTACQPFSVGCSGAQSAFTQSVTAATVSLTNTSTGPMASYLWDFGDGSTSTLASPTYSYTAVGTYTVCLTATDQCGFATSACSSVVITCVPAAPSFTYSMNQGSASFNGQAAGALTYSWDFGDGATSTLQNPTHVYTVGGTYTVCLTTTDACGPRTHCEQVMVSLVSIESQYLLDLRVYPNPVNENAMLRFSLSKPGNVSVKMFDALGKLVLEHEMGSTSGLQHVPLNMAGHAAGSYLIQIRVDDEVHALRVMKQE